MQLVSREAYEPGMEIHSVYGQCIVTEQLKTGEAPLKLRPGFWSQITWLQVAVLPLANSELLEKFLNILSFSFFLSKM